MALCPTCADYGHVPFMCTYCDGIGAATFVNKCEPCDGDGVEMYDSGEIGPCLDCAGEGCYLMWMFCQCNSGWVFLVCGDCGVDGVV